MAETVTGIVQEIQKFGKAYNVVIDDEKYGAGFNKPRFSEGMEISFTIEYNGKWANIDQKTLEVINDTPVEVTKASSKGKGGGQTKNGYWDAKEQRDIEWHARQVRTQREIRLQASRNAAAAFVELLFKVEAIKLPAKAAEKVEFVENLVGQYAETYYMDALSRGANENIDDAIMAQIPEAKPYE